VRFGDLDGDSREEFIALWPTCGCITAYRNHGGFPASGPYTTSQYVHQSWFVDPDRTFIG